MARTKHTLRKKKPLVIRTGSGEIIEITNLGGGLLGIEAPPGTEISTIALRVSRFGLPAGSAVLVAEGTAVRFTGDPGATRLALLTYLWQIDGSGWWIQAAVVVAGVAIALAVLLLWKSPRPAATTVVECAESVLGSSAL